MNNSFANIHGNDFTTATVKFQKCMVMKYNKLVLKAKVSITHNKFLNFLIFEMSFTNKYAKYTC